MKGTFFEEGSVSQLLKNIAFIYLLVINLTVFCMMYYDKQQAKKRKWRIPEFNLLLLGLIGGGVGGLLGQRLFHHKTKKIRFYFFFMLGTFVVGGIAYVAILSK